jgi:AcrR family transcriptional regulator
MADATPTRPRRRSRSRRSGNRQGRIDQRTRAARAKGRDGREALLEAAAKVFAQRGFREASVDEIAAEAGFSKGAVYWHFEGKHDLFFQLLDHRIDRPILEMSELLETAPAEHDMAPEASRLFLRLMQSERELLLLEHDYWSLAVRDPKLRSRYARRQAALRNALGAALAARARTLGTPDLVAEPEEMAGAFMALASGLARDKLIDPKAIPEGLLGDTFALIYAGLVARKRDA